MPIVSPDTAEQDGRYSEGSHTMSLNYMLSMLYLNLKPSLDIDDFGDLYHSMLYLKLMMHQ